MILRSALGVSPSGNLDSPLTRGGLSIQWGLGTGLQASEIWILAVTPFRSDLLRLFPLHPPSFLFVPFCLLGTFTVPFGQDRLSCSGHNQSLSWLTGGGCRFHLKNLRIQDDALSR